MASAESYVERTVCDWALMHLGIESAKLSGTPDMPDRIFFIPGRPLLIEFKALGEEPRDKQLWQHGRLRVKGYDVQVHDNVESAKRALMDAVGWARKLTQEDKTAALLRSQNG